MSGENVYRENLRLFISRTQILTLKARNSRNFAFLLIIIKVNANEEVLVNIIEGTA